MAGWVKWEKDLETDPRFTRAVRKVRELLRDASVTIVTHERDMGVPVTLPDRIVPIVTMGCLLKLWSYADTHIRSDDTLDLGLADIDELVCLPGFASALPEDWLVEIDDGHVELPGYQEHNGVEAKKRDLNAKRQERKRLRQQRDASVTSVTQQRDASVMGALPDQTRPDQTKTRPIHTERVRARDEPPGRDRKVPEPDAPPARNGKDPRAGPFDPTADSAAFQRVKAAYPKFAGRQDWIQAEHYCHNRLDDGETWDTLLAAAERYAAYCSAVGREGTNFVLSPGKFFSAADEPWKQPWEIPPETPARGRARANGGPMTHAQVMAELDAATDWSKPEFEGEALPAPARGARS